jgi:UDP-glucose 4-epimerase
VKALVTGGAGFIGSHIADLLLSEGNSVTILDNLASGQRRNVNRDAQFLEIDILNPELEAILREIRPEVVFHQAAQMSVKVSTDDPRYDARVNILGLINLLEACSAAGVRKVVFASSGATYGNPIYLPMDELHPQRPESPYGITKMASEHYLHYYALDRGVQYTALRYGNVYGPRQDAFGEAGVVAIFTRQLLDGLTPVIHWDGEQTRDYVHVRDVARANLCAATAGDGQRYCIGTGVPTSVNEIFQKLCDVLDLNLTPGRAPRRPGDLRAAYFDTRRGEAELGWKATISLIDGLRETVDYFRTERASEAPAGVVR